MESSVSAASAIWHFSSPKPWAILVVYSQTESKREDAFKLGADEVYITKGVEKPVIPGLAEGKKRGHQCVDFHHQWSAVPKLILPYLGQVGTDYCINGAAQRYCCPVRCSSFSSFWASLKSSNRSCSPCTVFFHFSRVASNSREDP